MVLSLLPHFSNRVHNRFSVLLVLCGLMTSMGVFSPVSMAKDTLKGGVVITEESPEVPTVNADDIKAIHTGTTLDMVITTSLASGVSVEGDEFFGKVTKDYTIDGKVVIPKGTVVHGNLTQVSDPKWGGRNGHITTNFDYMITPDGREIPIEGKHSTRDNKVKAAAKVVGRATGFTMVGGVVGSVMVLKYGGLAAVAASNGYALAGGAAVGGLVGLTSAMVTKGKNAMIQPGAEIRVKLTEELQLPTMNMPDVAEQNFCIPGLKVDMKGMRLAKDPFGELNEVTLSLAVVNQTPNTFTTFDIALEDENGNQHFASPFGDTGMWFRKLSPNSRMEGNLTFNVENPRLGHYLVFYKQYTREPVAKIALKTEQASLDGKKKAQGN